MPPFPIADKTRTFLTERGHDPSNVADYLAVPSVVACGGSWLVRPELVREGRFDEIERLAREVSGA